MTGYIRQSTGNIVSGQVVRASPLNNEFNAIQTAFSAGSGHTHDGSTGNAPQVNLTTSVTQILPVANGGTGAVSLDAAGIPTLTNVATFTNKTLTSPVINGGVFTSGSLSGTFSGNPILTGQITSTGGDAVTQWSGMILKPSDYGVGKPYLAFLKSTVADKFIIALWDSVNTNGTIDFQSGTLSWNGVTLATRTASETLTNKTLTSPTINTPTISTPAITGGTITSANLVSTTSGGSTIYTRANIVATVSQTSAIPTGGIIESGSNANGDYTKYADGTMICRVRYLASQAATTAEGNIYTGFGTTWNFPVPFQSGTPAVSGSVISSNRWFTFNTISQSAVAWYQKSSLFDASTSVGSSIMAIGRWY